MIEEEKIRKAKEKNRKIFPIYKMFSWDLLFYYSINFIFLSQAKGLSASDIFLGDSFYAIFKILSQPLIPVVVNIFGKRKANIAGNIFVAISILLMTLLEGSIKNLVISMLAMAIGFAFKGTCESCILEECIEGDKILGFSKIDSKGSTYHYIFSAISSIATGFMFVVNPYIPMYLCFIFCLIATLLSFKIEHYEIKKEKIKKTHPINLFIRRLDLSKQEYSFILKSKRIHALLLFAILFNGVLYIRSTITSSMFVDIGIPNQYFGIISAIFTIFAAIATWKQNFFQDRYKNRVLTFFSLTESITFILIGITAILNLYYSLTVSVILLMMAIQNIIKGPYYTLIKRYKNSFSNEHISTKIYSTINLMEDLGAMLVSFMVSILLKYTTTAYASLIIGIASLILFIIVLDYMKTRLGLKPEEYRKQDIEFNPKENRKANVVQIDVGLDERGKTNVRIY